VNCKRWLVLIGVALAVLFACCLATSGFAGFLWWSDAARQASSASALTVNEPPLDLESTQRQPTPAERETARLLASATVPQRDVLGLGQRFRDQPESLRTSSVRSIASPGDPPDYELGDAHTFWVHNMQTITYYTTTATLRYETPHAYWWIEEGFDVPDRSLQRAAERFENLTYPTGHRYFGSESSPGVDADPHIYIFLGNVPGAGGYFSVDDEYPVAVRPHSNEHEMFYINLNNAGPGNDYFDGIMAHEFQHMIHSAMDPNEDAWVNEGLSELASQVSGYDVGGSDRAFSRAPDTQLTTWPGLEDSAPHYGASYLLLAYFLEQYGSEAVRQLVAEQANGIAGFDAVLDQASPDHVQFRDLFADWLAANYLDDPGQSSGRYGYTDLNIEQPHHAAEHSTFPVGQRATVHQYAADYILLEGEGDLKVEFEGTMVVPLVGNQTHSGEYQWWSNRGDDGDATLTRAFDLTGLEEATLHAWMWYDLETDYDYAYVEVSTDGGETWDLLANEHTTTANPSGNSFGPALTGPSGGGEEASWVQQAFDLSPFAGQPVLIRFEAITDEAVNHPGLVLDGISIPELGYSDDAEEGDDGWQAEGWVRVTDHIPQEFLMQLITIGQETHVDRVALDDQMRGTATITGLGEEVDRAVLVVSALAPSTTEAASYTYTITQE
jgi:immune inhibitor A